MKTIELEKKLVIERELPASQEAVFDALTIPEQMNQWFYGMPEGYAKVEQDFRVGGKYTVHMHHPDGSKEECGGEEAHAPNGEYLEISKPDKLAFTWRSQGFLEHSVVTIELSRTDTGTHFKLTHELPTEDMIAPHTEGWNNCIGHLAATFI